MNGYEVQDDSLQFLDEDVNFLDKRNASDPNALVSFPGFGFWPLWYFEKFRERAFNLSTISERRKVKRILLLFGLGEILATYWLLYKMYI